LLTEHNKPLGYKCILNDPSTSVSSSIITTTESSIASSASNGACEFCEKDHCLPHNNFNYER